MILSKHLTYEFHLAFQCKHLHRFQFMIPKHITDRLSFSNEQLNGPVEWQEYVVFSDESRFCLNRLSSRILIKKGLYNEKSFCKEKAYDMGTIGKD